MSDAHDDRQWAAIDALKAEVDALQIHVMKRDRGWSVERIVTVLALLLSFATAAVSYFQTRQEDVEGKRGELRQLIERISAVPRERMELQQQYRADPSLDQLTELLDQESLVIARQAAQIIEQIEDHVTPIECIMVARALWLESAQPTVLRLYDIGEQRATHANEKLHVLNMRGWYLYPRDAAAGRRTFDRALVMANDPGLPDYLRKWHRANTLLFLARSQAHNGACAEARAHIGEAQRTAIDQTQRTQIASAVAEIQQVCGGAP